jgi:hypothetical protein
VTPTMTHFDLLDAFKEEGCAVCRLTLRSVERFIESANRDLVNSPDFWNGVKAALGFCNLHAQQWLTSAHPLGTAYLYEAVLGQIGEELERQRPGRQFGLLGRFAGRGDARALMPEKRCPVCIHREEHEAAVLRILLSGLGDEAFQRDYQSSPGLCFPHLRSALAGASGETFDLLRAHALAEQTRLRVQLKEIIRKHDYRFRDEPTGEERGATDRAVNHVAGAAGIDDR